MSPCILSSYFRFVLKGAEKEDGHVDVQSRANVNNNSHDDNDTVGINGMPDSQCCTGGSTSDYIGTEVKLSDQKSSVAASEQRLRSIKCEPQSPKRNVNGWYKLFIAFT